MCSCSVGLGGLPVRRLYAGTARDHDREHEPRDRDHELDQREAALARALA